MQITITKIDHVQLAIPSGGESVARRFFGEVLGLEEIEKPEALKPKGGLWFKIANIQLHLGIEDAQTRSRRHPAFEVVDLENIRAYLGEQGVEIKDEIAIPGMSRFSFFDPFGNRIEFLEKEKTIA